MANTKLIVTGLSGLIGSRFEELYGHKFDFVNLDLTQGVDITDPNQVDEQIKNAGADIILHLAGYTNVDEAHKQNGDESAACYQVNVVGTKNIATAAKKHNKYLIHISTDMVFSGNPDKTYRETDKPDPIDWYGITKAKAEEVVTQTFDNYAIIRPAYPFRAQFKDKPDVVRKIIEGLKNDSLPPMFSDHTITPTFIDDLCKVFFMFTLKRLKGIYHATGSAWITDYELAKLVKDTFELPGEVKEGSLKEFLKTAKRPYQRSLKISNEKLQEELGNPMLPIQSALQIMKTQM